MKRIKRKNVLKRTTLSIVLALLCGSTFAATETVASIEKEQESIEGWYFPESIFIPPNIVFNGVGFTTEPYKSCPGGWYWETLRPELIGLIDAPGGCKNNQAGTVYPGRALHCLEDDEIILLYDDPTATCEPIYECPDGDDWELSEDKKTCSRSLDGFNNKRPPILGEYINGGYNSCIGNTYVGNPIHVGTGNKIESVQDINIAGAPELNVWRFYNSRYMPSDNVTWPWKHSFQYQAQLTEDGKTLNIEQPDGKVYIFTFNGSDWQAETNTVNKLFEQKDTLGNPTGWILVQTETDTEEHYNRQGKLTLIKPLNGDSLSFSYSDGVTEHLVDSNGTALGELLPAGTLTKVTNAVGQSIEFTYNINKQLAFIYTPSGHKVSYQYTNNLLTQVIQTDASKQQYLYENAQYPNALTGIINELNERSLTVTYDQYGRAISSGHAEGSLLYQVNYLDGNNAIVTDPLGTESTYQLQNIAGLLKTNELTQPCTSGCAQSNKYIEYNDLGLPIRLIDWDDNVQEITYNERGLPSVTVEGLKDSNGVSITQPETRTSIVQWHNQLPLPIKASLYAGKADLQNSTTGTLIQTVENTYDTQGNLLKTIEIDSNNQQRKEWNYTYTTRGRVLTVQDPTGSITAYSYYSDTDSLLGRRGQLHTITEPLGQVTTIEQYNSNGQPTHIVLPSGLVQTLTYDARDRLVELNENGRITQYQYLANGKPQQIIAPDGSITIYHYDKAERLIAVTDPQGNKAEYQLNNMGSPLKVTTKDKQGNIFKVSTYQYNALNQLINVTE